MGSAGTRAGREPQGSHRGAAAGGHLPEVPTACTRLPRTEPPSPLGHSYLDIIEQAVSQGQMLLIEDVGETVEPVLDHLLGRNTTKKGRSAHPVLWCRGISPALNNCYCSKILIYAPLCDSSWGLILPLASGHIPQFSPVSVGTPVVDVMFWTVLEQNRVQFV